MMNYPHVHNSQPYYDVSYNYHVLVSQFLVMLWCHPQAYVSHEQILHLSICFTLAFQAAPVATRQEPLGVDGLHVAEGTLLTTTNQNYQQEQIIQVSICKTTHK